MIEFCFKRLRGATFIGVLLTLCLSACTSLVRPGYTTQLGQLQGGQYELDTKHATVLFKVSHFGFSYYVGRFNSLQASLNYDLEQPRATRLRALVDTASIDVNNPEFASELAGPGWLDSGAYPQAVLTIEGAGQVDGDGNSDSNTSQYTGTLELHGQQAPVKVQVRFNGGAKNRLTGRYTIGFAASATFKRSDFGIKKYLGLVGDEVELEIHVEFQKVG